MKYEKIKNFILEPIVFYLTAAFVVFAILYKLDKSWLTWENKSDILVEFHGLFFDIILFGILFIIFTQIGERRKEIKRYQENIDDMKGWNEPEATFKIIGNLKRLLALKATNIDLAFTFLKKGLFSGLKIEKIKFDNCILDEAIFQYSKCNDSTFLNSSMSLTDLRYCDLTSCNFSKVSSEQGTFQGSKLCNAKFEHSSIIECDFSYIDFDPNWSDYEDIKRELMSKSYLSENDLVNNIVRVDFSNATLSYGTFDKSKFDKTIMKGTLLNGATFKNSSMVATNFSKADLRSTIFESANLDNAIFDNSQLYQTNFNNASMKSISIRNCNFAGCSFENTIFSTTQKVELASFGIDISKAKFE